MIFFSAISQGARRGGAGTAKDLPHFLNIIKSYREKSVFSPTTLSHLSASPLSK